MKKDEAEALMKKHKTLRAAASAAGVCKTTLHRALRGNPVRTDRKPAHTDGGTKTRTLADFRREHDQVWKIRDGIKRLLRNGAYMTDGEFRESVGGSSTRWRAAADSPEFRENRYRVGGEWLWASKETIREMRKIKGEAI